MGERKGAEGMMREMEKIKKSLEVATENLHDAQDLFSDAMSKNPDDKDEVIASAQLLAEARDLYGKAADAFIVALAEAPTLTERADAAEGQMESAVGSMQVALETGDHEAVAASAAMVAEASGALTETIEGLQVLSSEEQDELDALTERLGVTDERTSTILGNRLKRVLSGMPDRDVSAAAEQVESEHRSKGRRFTKPNWAENRGDRKS
jgi:hypothetical protein